jgi:tetratricopeptide (TPR) repeat protein
VTRGLPLGALLATLLLVLATAAGAAVTARATLDPLRVPVGQSSDLSVEVRGTQSSPAPRIGPIDGLSISYVGPATQLSIVNGQTSASITHHFAVTPQREGTFTIGPITVQADGQSLQTGSVTLQTASAGAGGGAPAPATDPLTLELRAQSRTVYLHERLPLTLTLRIGDVRVADLQYPQVPGDGFALEAFPQPTQRQETRDGTAYQIVEFDGALTPLRTGSVTVGPATVSLTTLSERATRRGFFFGGTVRQPREVLSQPLVLDVLPLPETGKPADFSGAVGRFMLEVKAAPLDVTAGDPVTLTYSLHGEGDLSSATPPALVGSDTLRVYPVQGVASPPTAPAGSRTFEQVVIPQRPGSVRLPLPRFSFFDPQARAYRVAETQPITLTVRAAPAAATTPQIVGAPAPRAAKPAEQVGHDIVFIKDTPGTLASPDVHLWRSALFWLLLVIPPLVWLAALLIDRRRLRLGTDVRYARFTRAGRTARAALNDARAALTQGDAAIFYDRVARAVSDYLAAKLDLPPGGVTPEEMNARLRDVGLPGEVADELRVFLASCEEVRFAPAAGDGDMRRTLSRAESLVRALERSRHLGRAAAAVLLLLIAAGASAATDNPQAMFFRANSLYADGRYAEAAAEYEHVLGTGVASANVYFNLGNAYLKAGDVGRAVLAYERARRLAPGDPDLRANLAFAREQNGEDDEPPRWTRVAFPLAAVWPSDTVLVVAAAAWWALFLLLAARHVLPAARRALGWAVLAAGVLFAVSGTSAAYRLWTVDFRREAVVVASTPVAVRFEPTSGGTVHFRAMTGSQLRLLGDERDGWVQVARPDGLRGWVERDAVGSL